MVHVVGENPRIPYHPVTSEYVSRLVNQHGRAIEKWADEHNLPQPEFHNEPEFLFPVGYKPVPVGIRMQVPSERLSDWYKCGHFGCVFNSEDQRVVVKVTTDVNEAQFIQAVLHLKLDMTGIVRYDSIARFPSKFHGRNVFILWREEAQQIGSWAGSEEPRDQTQNAGALVGAYHSVSRHLLRLDEHFEKTLRGASYWNKIKTFWDAMDDNMGEMNKAFGEIERSHYFLTGAILNTFKTHPGYFTWLLFALHQLAERLMYFPTFSQYGPDGDGEDELDVSEMGRCLKEVIDHKMVIADLHFGNIGESQSSPGIKIVTDPGLVIFLDRGLADLEIPKL
jgi:hypothetical protein